jgi:chromosome segregation ATPase
MNTLSSNQEVPTQYGVYRSLSNEYQRESLEYAQRCRTLENVHAKTLNELNQIRSQLNVTKQLTIDQATHIVDLERRLMKSNELIKTANQQKLSLEQQLRDLNLTFEKYQRSTQGQLNQYAKQNDFKLNEKNSLERELRDLSLTFEKYQRSTQGQLNAYSKQNDQIKVLEIIKRLLNFVFV